MGLLYMTKALMSNPIDLSSIKLKKIVTYEKAKLKFIEPFYVVRGDNQDRKQKQSANGVGKSLFFSALPTLLYAAPPSADKKNSARSMHEKDSSIEIVLNNGKHEIKVTQEMTTRSLRLRLNIDGEEQEYRETSKAKEALTKLFPIPEEQFYAFNYLDVMRFNPLLKGNAAQRFNFFEGVFDFDSYDVAYKVLAEKLTDLQHDAALLKKLEERYAEESKELGQGLSNKEIEALSVKTKSLHKRIKKLSKTISIQTKKVQAAISYIAVAEPLGDKSLDGLEQSENDYTERLEKEQLNLQKTKDNHEKQTAYQRYLNENKQYIRKKHNLENLLKKYSGNKKSIKLADLEISVIRLEENKEALLAAKTELTKLQDWLDNVNKIKLTEEKPDEKLFNKLKDRLTALKAEYKKLSKVKTDDGKCPSCFQPVSSKHIKSELKRVKSAYEAALTRAKRIAEQQKAFAVYEEYMEKQDKAKQLRSKIKGLQQHVDEGLKNKKLVKKLRKRKIVESRLKDLEKPKKVEGNKTLLNFNYQELVKTIEHNIDDIKETLRVIKAIKGLSIKFKSLKEAKTVKAELEVSLEENNKRIIKLNESVADITTKIEVSKAANSSLDKLKKQIDELKIKTKRLPIVSKLKEAYGSRGIRLYKMQDMANQYVSNMNSLSRLLYPEPMEFSCSISKGTFGIFVERNNKRVSDVRFMSGHESRCFMALSALALAPFIPPHKRFNFIIFDEIEAGMDIPSRRLFMEEFIPALQQVFSTIVCLTPKDKSEFFSPHAKELVVRKKNGVSRLIGV